MQSDTRLFNGIGGIEELFSFTGRIRRLDFWVCQSVLIFFILGIPNRYWLGMEWEDQGHSPFALWVVLSTLWVNLALFGKRCRDRGKSPWFCLLVFVPVIGWMWILIELFLSASAPPNQPLHADHASRGW